MKLSKIFSATAVAAVLLASTNLVVNPAAAANLDAISVYLDAPLVQGSYVAQAAASGTASSSFNNTLGLNHCGDGLPAGVTITGNCRIDSVASYGGATPLADDPTQTVAGAGSNYATTVNSTDAITISMTSDNRYLGLWWSAGSASNTIQFLKDDTVLLTMTTADIVALLGTAPTTAPIWASKDNDDAANLLTTVDGNKYRKMWYFGNPRGYAANPPTTISTLSRNEPFVYLHMFVAGALTFNKIKLSGAGFEFDNLAVSDQVQTPAASLVEVNKIYANHSVTFEANGADTVGSMTDQVGSAAANLTTNAFTRAGYTFQGWNTQADGNGTAYADAASFDFDANVTLYAVWLADAPPVEEPVETPTESPESAELAATGGQVVGSLQGGFSLLIVGLAMTFFVGRKRLNK